MTEVMSSSGALRRDRHMSFDDNQLDYSTSSTDWRAKYLEVADMLSETKAELDDFHHASKELEAELESELQRTEKAQQDLKIKVSKAEADRDDWKSKFMALQTTHNTTTTSLQRELDKLRQEHQQLKVQYRDLEMGNDDLERNERAVTSSLADMEAKYSRALEEKILLEHELLEKASLEEDCQRLRDELRDATEEISILRKQIEDLKIVATNPLISPPERQLSFPAPQLSSEDDLLHTVPPDDLDFDEASPPMSSPTRPTTIPEQEEEPTVKLPPQRKVMPSKLATPNANSRVLRSTTLPVLTNGSSIASPYTPTTRTLAKPQVTATLATSTQAATVPKNRGVQMVSEMRARVRNLEQKIHTRVPRLRMASITNRGDKNGAERSAIPSFSASSRTSVSKLNGIGAFTRRSNESSRSSSKASEPADTSGWVLIMEDSPSPKKDYSREKRRISSPSPTTPHASTSSSVMSPSFIPQAKSASRRPHSRMSATSMSTATTSSISTPASRPATPTFIPLPTSNTTTGLRRAATVSTTKRASLGGSNTLLPEANFDDPSPFQSRPPSSQKGDKALPSLPSSISNVTIRPTSKSPGPATAASVFSQSRIAKPSRGPRLSGNKSTLDSSKSST